ncbi:hypothetical protein ASPWEDRAFT_115243 [Aspergillus wentii DTO 134E9]|uniref:Queuine tRNA-ribosyltransferase accessory subunit 2 n=1 Tax=Aspergillus wentii DTO 134E9 TaxID=1073089 RepID=A0A1L9RDK9_ASPWE|nr:uncharacterized protein ASPWEDRAFT_115243 [Aspergillus wentii DTO 134E9]OJJ33005.1 hypothetical protein ASPWEDRAFT_115243 [Aspergillus wentii DTO 134E9]
MGSDPDKMASFTILSPAAAPVLAPRLGKLAIAGRKAVSTPHYIPLTTRGAVPHITHDLMRDQTEIGSLYVGLEDFIEKKPEKAPLYKVPTEPHESKLRKFMCMPEDVLLILGARRVPPVACPPTNTPNSVSVLTAVGFHQLEAEKYVDAVHKLQPDIVVGLADLVMGHKPGIKRRGKMVDRTHAFTMHATEHLYDQAVAGENRSNTAYFAPVLPLDNAEQSIYLDELEAELRQYISGLALYESDSLSLITELLGDLPRLLFSDPATPHDILREVSLGADLLTLPFMTACSDAGIAFDFSFPAPAAVVSEPRPLAFDLWSSEYTTDTRPFSEGCQCYACRNHHRAYLHHLLSAKEMLAWTLLQIHNHHTMDVFFAQIRESIERGTFEQDCLNFNRAYSPELPEKTGQGPRLRGYHLPAAGPHQAKRFPKVYGRLDAAAEKFAESQSSVVTPDAGADELEARGFAEKK